MSGDRQQPSLAELDARLQRLEVLVAGIVEGVPQARALSQSEAISSSGTTLIHESSRVAVKGSTHTTSPATDARSPQTTSGTSSAKFLGAVGVLCFMLAGSYFIKLAITEGWITPTMQLMALVVFALSLIFGGFVLRDSDSQYASLLPGTGVVLLYMAAYGGHIYFRLYDMSVATFVVNAVSLGALVLYSSFRQHFYALASSVGTYLVPVLLGDTTWSFLPLCIYVMVWNVTFSVIAASLGSRLLLGLTAYLAVSLVLIFGEHSAGSDLYRSQFTISVFQALQFLLFCVMIAWYSIRRREPLSHSEAWSFFPLLLLFYASEYQMIERLHAGLAPWCALAFGACVYGTYTLAKKFFGLGTLASYPMVSSFVSLVAVHVVYLQLSPSFLKPWLAVAVLLHYGRHMTKDIAGSSGKLSVYILSFVPLIEYVKALNLPEPGVSATYRILLNFAFAAALLFAAHEARAVKSSTSPMLATLGAVQFLLGLRYLSEFAFEPVTAAYVTSALWSATALLLLLVAQRFCDRTLASKASWLFGLTAIKVLLFDLSESGTGERIVALLVIGALFYAGGYVFRRIAP
jgi:uncharacterized membrane protein